MPLAKIVPHALLVVAGAQFVVHGTEVSADRRAETPVGGLHLGNEPFQILFHTLVCFNDDCFNELEYPVLRQQMPRSLVVGTSFVHSGNVTHR